jgi:hypothetical protein
MNDPRFLVHRRALLGYDALTGPERESLEGAVAPLVDLPEGQWPTAGAKRLESPEPLYLLKVDASLRAIVRPTPAGRPEVLDLVRHETLRQFFNGAG